MAFFNRLGSNLKTLATKKVSPQTPIQDIGITRIGFGTEQEREAIYPQWFFSSRLGQPRAKFDMIKLRNLSQSAWVQMVLNTFKKEINTIEWRIVPEDETDGIDYTEDINTVTEFMNKINKNNQNIDNINSEVITDLGEIDAGVFNYVYSSDSYDIGDVPVYDAIGKIIAKEIGLILKPIGSRTLTQIKSVDGGSMLKQVDIHKNLLRFYQYSFKHPRQNPTPFEPAEISYLIMNSKSYSIYGFSPVQSIQQVLELLIQGTRYNKDMFTNNAIPDLLIGIDKIPLPELKKLKRKWNNEYAGKPHQVSFINWGIDKIHKLGESNRDLEWLDGQKWYSKIVFAAFGVSPTEAGFFENANKSNDEGQARVTVRNAIKPFLTLLEQQHTTRTIPEILQKEKSGLKFKYFPKDHVQEKVEFDQHKWELENGALTINDYRKLQGKEPYEWGDEPFKKPGQETSFNFGGLPNNNPDETEEENPKKPDKKEEKEEKKDYNITKPKAVEDCVRALMADPDFKPQAGRTKEESAYAVCQSKHGKSCPSCQVEKDLIIEAGEEIIDESKTYSEFLTNLFNDMEKKVLTAVDKMGLEKSYKIDKTFGEFVKNLFNIVNTATFAKHVKRFIKADLVTGLVSAEEELNVDIGFTDAYKQKLNVLSQEQLNGYKISGKKWFGIKGVSKEIQSKIIMTVQSGISEHKTIKEIKEDIKNDFAGFSDHRANLISRTETNRVLNESKLLGYKESGLEGGKVVKVALDNRTSDICKRLHTKYANNPISLDEPFIDDKNMKEYTTPPFHVQCRTTIAFRPK